MSERGTLRIVVEGDDAQRFHETLMDFVSKAKEDPDYRLEDPVCESYWKIALADEERKAEENSCFFDYYSSKDEFKGYVTIYWDDYKYEEGLLRMTASWFNTLGFISLVSFTNAVKLHISVSDFSKYCVRLNFMCETVMPVSSFTSLATASSRDSPLPT